MFTFEQTKAGYRKLWTEAKVRPEREAALKAIVAKIISNKPRYLVVEKQTGVPWFVVACLHSRESDFNFGTYLGNGQSLTRITTEVPVGRGPFDSFEAGAVDALREVVKLWIASGRPKWTGAFCCFSTEAFNGQGYFSKGNSPYVWSWTNQYTSGKYVRDHVYDASAVDPQCGCAAILKELESSGAITLQSEESPMVTIPIPMQPGATAPSPHFSLPPINIAEIDQAISTLSTILPIVSTFFPPLKIALPFLPIAKGLVDMVAQIESAPPGTDFGTLVAAHLHALADQVKAVLPPQPTV